MKAGMYTILIVLVAAGGIGSVLALGGSAATSGEVKKFSSYDELQDFVKKGLSSYESLYKGAGIERVMSSTDAATAAESGSDFSTTNIQVAGVDEPDLVKNDGRYIYTISGTSIAIVDAFPAEQASLVSTIELDDYPTEIFLNGDKLIVFGGRSFYHILGAESRIAIYPYPYFSPKSFVYVYDIADRSNPVLERNITVDGTYLDARMIDNHVYAILNSPIQYQEGEPVPLPAIETDGVKKTVPAEEISYIAYPDYSYSYTTILSFDVQNPQAEPNEEVIMMGSTQNIFVSRENIYITYPDYASGSQKTLIHRIAINNGNAEFQASGEVPGYVLNQFSMDEHDGYFRIATTHEDFGRAIPLGIATVSSASSDEPVSSPSPLVEPENDTRDIAPREPSMYNSVYTLDSNLNIVGSLEKIAPDERIYSVRFMGDRAYMVTFKRVDPLFVIDLSDAANPRILGELKIPGFSDYLHPYDEMHLIGLGKEVDESGEFALTQGVKLGLFDVSDPANPVDIAKYEIGDRGTDSEALYDHHAFLFSRERNLLVIPIVLAEVKPGDFWGTYVSQGAYVFDVNLDSGFSLKGSVTHVPSGERTDYYAFSPYSVKRSLYIDGVLYTVSDKSVKANNLSDLSDISSVDLPYTEQQPIPFDVKESAAS
jgi:uncharacterized secreted protein with C-terminal beta-propeller domain